jgi:hypothetical protein
MKFNNKVKILFEGFGSSLRGTERVKLGCKNLNVCRRLGFVKIALEDSSNEYDFKSVDL